MSTHPPENTPLLAFGAHPDDIEFGCGGVIAAEARRGRPVHMVICSRGESGTNGTPDQRVAETEKAANLLGATLEFIDLGGDAHFECNVGHTLKLAGIIRERRPGIVVAPSLVENQHPDHWKLGRMARDAARLARFGGVEELRAQASHAIASLWFYAVTVDAEPKDLPTVFVDVSETGVVAAWRKSMEAHATQQQTRNYTEMQLLRARLNGSRCQAEYAIPLFPNDPLVGDSLASLSRTARRY